MDCGWRYEMHCCRSVSALRIRNKSDEWTTSPPLRTCCAVLLCNCVHPAIRRPTRFSSDLVVNAFASGLRFVPHSIHGVPRRFPHTCVYTSTASPPHCTPKNRRAAHAGIDVTFPCRSTVSLSLSLCICLCHPNECVCVLYNVCVSCAAMRDCSVNVCDSRSCVCVNN